MARKIDKMKSELIGNVFSLTELENYMFKYEFVLVEADDIIEANQNIIKFTNHKSQIWIEVDSDENNNVLISNLKSVPKIVNEPSRVEPFRSYEDLEKILNYFKNKQMYHHWFTSCLMVSLGRRVGDTIALKWSDLFSLNGKYRERLSTLKEEKTGKIIGVKLNALAQYYIEEYCRFKGLKPMEHYKEKIFSNSACAFRKALKQAIQEVGLDYPISTHSFRKYYANTIYKLHPQDSDNLMIVQTMMGHSDIETTKIYINEIDRKSDRYISDYADYMLKKKDGKEIKVSNSPILSLKSEDFRDILNKCWNMANSKEDKFDAINELIGIAEQRMIS